MHDLVDRYCARLREGHFAEQSKRSYVACMRRFARAFPAETVLADLTPAAVQRWFTLFSRRRSPNSVHTQAAIVRGFFAWCVEEGFLVDNPMRHLVLPKKVKPRREHLADTDVARLLAACDRIGNPRRRAQAKAVFSILAYTGLRRSEMLALRLGDVFLAERRLEVRCGKGGKPRTVYFFKSCAVALRDWLRERPKTPRHDYLLTANVAHKLGALGLQHLQQDVYAIAGIALPSRPCHILRHSYATRLLNKTQNIPAVQEAMGHEDGETTLIYWHPPADAPQAMAELAELSTPTPALTEPAPRFRIRRRKGRS